MSRVALFRVSACLLVVILFGPRIPNLLLMCSVSVRRAPLHRRMKPPFQTVTVFFFNKSFPMLAIERLVFRSTCMLAGMSWRGLSACFCAVVSETTKRPKSLRVTERLREASTCNHVSTKYDATTGVPNQVCVYEVLCLSWLVAH